jgi:lipopolysaccharide export system permease protein
MKLKTVDKLMLRSYVGPMVLAFAIVMFVLLLNFLWKYVEDMVGKGLTADVVAELIGYFMITVIPMGLPLATLFGAIMTMGNLGENYELLAMKSAGMSLMRILRPILILTGLIAVGGFFISNNLVPLAWQRSRAIIYDVRRQKQNIEFQDGIFFNGIDGMSVRVDRQRPEDNLLIGVLMYDNTDPGRDNTMTTTLADSGYIHLSDDKRNLVVRLFNGVRYETKKQVPRDVWFNESTLTANRFAEQYVVTSLEGFDMERTDADLFSGGNSKKIGELQRNIDSLALKLDTLTATSYKPLLQKALFVNDTTLMFSAPGVDSLHIHPVSVLDSIGGFGLAERQRLWRGATREAEQSRNLLSWDEDNLKLTLRDLYDHRIAWHEKVALPFSIMIFFLIGAALGAIIRRGGLGMPVVVSVLFFVVYYVMMLFGKKMSQEGVLQAWQGMWMSSFILFPVAVFLTFKATNDSNLFNPEWYIYRWRALKKLIIRK